MATTSRTTAGAIGPSAAFFDTGDTWTESTPRLTQVTFTVTLKIMGGDADINVFWAKLHTIDGSGSTVPARFEDVIAAGAAGYAALEWASFSTNRVNVGGRDVWREYLGLGPGAPRVVPALAGPPRAPQRRARSAVVRAGHVAGGPDDG